MGGQGQEGEGAPNIQLLSDISQAFDELELDKLSSHQLVNHLVAREDRPWQE